MAHVKSWGLLAAVGAALAGLGAVAFQLSGDRPVFRTNPRVAWLAAEPPALGIEADPRHAGAGPDADATVDDGRIAGFPSVAPRPEPSLVEVVPADSEDGVPDPGAETYSQRWRRIERTFVVAGESKAADLATSGGWMRSLALHAALPPVAGPDAELARFRETLALAANPVARQNQIFLAVLTLPPEVSHPWLRSLVASGPAGDAEDALLALAFDGDDEGRDGFARLAGAAASAPVHRLVDDWLTLEELGQSGTEEDRAVLRSYRAIEVLDRQPYFKVTFVFTNHAEWRSHPARTPDLDRELLPCWLARYPGHPGSDDMAFRLGRLDTAQGAHYEAARWYGRAATLPDQDLRFRAVNDMVATCELLLTPEELDRLAHEQGYLTPNRTLVQYIRLRRLAAERSFDVAIRFAAALGHDEPFSPLGYAWNRRYAAPVPKGLDSGLAPLAADDPLRTQEEPAPPLVRPEGAPRPARIPSWCLNGRWEDDDWNEQARLNPWPERLQLDEATLMRQFRAWETIATLDVRVARTSGNARADLLYKEAAVHYHDPRVLFPAYGDIYDFRVIFRQIARNRYNEAPGDFGAFVRTSYPLLKAIALFDRIEREHPRYPGLDKVLYSKGLAWAKLGDYQCDAVEGGYGTEDERPWATKVRNAVEAFERCAALCPRSALADDALRAAAYWREERASAFEG